MGACCVQEWEYAEPSAASCSVSASTDRQTDRPYVHSCIAGIKEPIWDDTSGETGGSRNDRNAMYLCLLSSLWQHIDKDSAADGCSSRFDCLDCHLFFIAPQIQIPASTFSNATSNQIQIEEVGPGGGTSFYVTDAQAWTIEELWRQSRRLFHHELRLMVHFYYYLYLKWAMYS